MNVKVLKATASPLASIFGSGFLVIVPILAGATGAWAPVAMALVCAVAFAVGSVVRFNILHAEPVLSQGDDSVALSLERCSDFALIVAYVISVSLYLHILASFVLGGFGYSGEIGLNALTTFVILVIAAIGLTKGLEELDFLETVGLIVTLVIIAFLVAAFVSYDLDVLGASAGIVWPQSAGQNLWQVLTIVAGTLIVVQGFETPRYLGALFDTKTRVRASRLSQIVATLVYLVFVAVTLPAVHTLNGVYDDNSLIALVATVAAALSVPLVIAAALSQFSAAFADTHAATGNLEEITHGHLQAKWGCILVSGGAIALTWSSDTLQILALASRAFAFYYLMQCLVAIRVAQSSRQKVLISILAAVLAFVTVFAVPAG